jgi:hypothetical protein
MFVTLFSQSVRLKKCLELVWISCWFDKFYKSSQTNLHAFDIAEKIYETGRWGPWQNNHVWASDDRAHSSGDVQTANGRSSPLLILSALELLHGKGHNHTLGIVIEEQVLNFQKKLCAWTPG